MGSRISVSMRQSLFDNISSQEIGFFDVTKTGEMTSRMTQDCQKVADQVRLNVNVFLRTAVQIFTTLIFMFTLNVSMTLVAFISVPVVIFISRKYGAVMKALSEKSQTSLADANAVAEECLGSMQTVRMFAAERLEGKRFGAKLDVYNSLQVSTSKFYLLYLSTTLLLPQLVTALVLFYGGKVVLDGGMKANDLLSFMFYLQLLNDYFSTVGDFYSNMVQAMGAAKRVFELRHREAKLPLEPSVALLPPDSCGELRLEGVKFEYPAREGVRVLNGLSLTVPRGAVVALVGPSGNGKSTVIGLLKRLYAPSEGRVLLDGANIWDFSHAEYHRCVSIVGQEPVLFARTVKDNILYGLTNPGEGVESLEHVQEVCKVANAHQFISDMPQGYDTEVGERGVQLSGGQKQRIAIARALVRRPKVLLLDEATSALDAESEQQVQLAIDAMIKGGNMTVVVIAHRLSTVRNSTKICFIQGGLVVEEGTHDDLVAADGAYFKLISSQLAKQ